MGGSGGRTEDDRVSRGKPHIRELAADDYDALVALWTAAALPFRPNGRDTRECIAREIEGPCSVFLKATVGGRLIAAVLGTHDGRKGWINRLAVHPEHQRQGTGAALVRELEARFKAMGIQIVACMIEDWNETSMEVFEKLGYRQHPEIAYLTKRAHPDA